MRADFRSRATLALVSAIVVAASAGSTAARAQDRHGKTIKQCTDEMKANAAVLAKAGEGTAEFFHTCWWKTAAGHPTPIRGIKAAPPASPSDRVATTQAQAEMAKAKQEVATARAQAAEAEADAAKTRKAMTIEAARADAAAKAAKMAQARATAAAATAQADARERGQAKAERVAEAKTKQEAVAKASAAAEAKRAVDAKAAAQARREAREQAAARASAAADAATKVKAEEAGKVAAAAQALAEAKAQQALHVEAATKAAKAAGVQTRPSRPETLQPRQAAIVRRASPPMKAHLAPRMTYVRRFFPRRPRETFVVRQPARIRIPFAAARPRRRTAPTTVGVLPRPGAPAPLITIVPVNVAGLPAPVPIAVLPSVAPAFRKMVNHPMMPGFTSTP